MAELHIYKFSDDWPGSHELQQGTERKIYSLTFQNVCYSTTNAKGERRQILSSVSGMINSGEILAILGPSGAGEFHSYDSV